MSEYFLNSFPQNIIEQKYQIKRQLGSTRGKKTLLAKDIKSNALVVIELFTLDNDYYRDDLQKLKQEIEIFKSLSHPSIPTYIDIFRVNTEKINGFALVQSYIEATSLAVQIKSGRSFTEIEVKQIAKQILEILNYLHSHQPPIIHHNIKPNSILSTDRSGNNIGKIYLVDFGRQNLIINPKKLTTVRENQAFIQPEQPKAKIKPIFDLSSLGKTLISLVVRKSSLDLSNIDLIMESPEFNNWSLSFKNWLKKITISPSSSELTSANKALLELEKCDKTETEINSVKSFCNQPFKSKIKLHKNKSIFELAIPSIGLFSLKTFFSVIGLFFCLIPWTIVLLQILEKVPLLKIIDQPINIIITFTLCSFLAILTLALISKGLFTKKVLGIDEYKITFFEKIFTIKYRNLFANRRSNLSLVEKIVVVKQNQSKYYLNIIAERKKCQLANDFYFPIKHQEIDWLAREISIWLDLPLLENEINEYDFKQANLYSKKAHTCFLKDNYTEAIEKYTLSLHFNPESFTTYLNRAITNLYTHNYQSVIADCSLALKINAKCAEAYSVRGVAYYYLKEYRNAIKNFHTTININPQYQETYYYLAASYIALEEYLKAIQTCNQVIEINPQYARAYQMRANAYFALYDYQNTIKDCNYALQIDSKFTEAYMLRGITSCYLGNLKQSLSDFTKQIKLEPSAYGYYHLGSIQFILDKYSQAIDSFSACLQVKPDFKFAYYARANIYYELNRREFALQDFKTATEIEAIVSDEQCPEDEHNYYIRGLAKYTLDNNMEGAIQDIEKAERIAGKHQYYLLVEKVAFFAQIIRDSSCNIN